MAGEREAGEVGGHFGDGYADEILESSGEGGRTLEASDEDGYVGEGVEDTPPSHAVCSAQFTATSPTPSSSSSAASSSSSSAASSFSSSAAPSSSSSAVPSSTDVVPESDDKRG